MKALKNIVLIFIIQTVIMSGCSEDQLKEIDIDDTPSSANASLPSVGDIITLKASNGKYVSARPNDGKKLKAAQTYEGSHEKFEIVNAGGGLIALKNIGTGKYVNFPGNANHALVADRTSIGGGEKASIVAGKNSGQLAIRADNTSNFICNESNGNDYVKANRTNIGTWESFTFNVVSGEGSSSTTGLHKASGTKLRLAQYNVKQNRTFYGSRENSFDRIVNALDADIWILNEVSYGDTYYANEPNEYTQTMKSITGIDWDMSWDQQGRMVLSQYPILWDDEIVFRVHASYIDLPGSVSDQNLVIINVHLPSGSGKAQTRADKAQSAVNFANDIRNGGYSYSGGNIPSSVSIIIAGDFNSGPGAEPAQIINDAGFDYVNTYHYQSSNAYQDTWGRMVFDGSGTHSLYNSDNPVDRYHTDMRGGLVRKNHFVLNTLIMNTSTLNNYGLQRADVAVEPEQNYTYINQTIDCDHWPIVMDFD